MTDNRNERRALGRGLNALLADIGVSSGAALESPPAGVIMVPIERLIANPDQPRRVFDEAALEELVASIRAKGILQPLLVRPHGDGYMIVAGERRWRAAQRAQLHTLPVLVRDYSDNEVLEVAIIENIQRADLNPIDEAQAYRQLIERFGHTQEKVAAALGKSRSHIANSLRLLALPPEVSALLQEGQITMGHARALLGTDDAIALARQVVAKGLTVRDVERLSRQDKTGRDTTRHYRQRGGDDDPDRRALEGDLSAAIGMGVRIQHDENSGRGRVTIEYASLDDLDRLARLLSGG